jgi:hypothetical protein
MCDPDECKSNNLSRRSQQNKGGGGDSRGGSSIISNNPQPPSNQISDDEGEESGDSQLGCRRSTRIYAEVFDEEEIAKIVNEVSANHRLSMAQQRSSSSRANPPTNAADAREQK